MKVTDINTSDQTIDGTPPGQAFVPTRYSTTQADVIRISTWLLLSTIKGTYRFDLEQGLDVAEIMDPGTSDAERSALVAEIVLGVPGVTAITAGPTVTFDGTTYSIAVTATTAEGSFTVFA